MTEKPLHVQVAAALGCRERRDRDGTYRLVVPGGVDQISFVEEGASWSAAPRYDTDWSATGPLIEKYRITLVGFETDDWEARYGYQVVPSFCDDRDGGPEWDLSAEGHTPLVAVCNLILALHEAGKLAA